MRRFKVFIGLFCLAFAALVNPDKVQSSLYIEFEKIINERNKK